MILKTMSLPIPSAGDAKPAPKKTALPLPNISAPKDAGPTKAELGPLTLDEYNDGWRWDASVEKKYKPLPINDPEIIKANPNGLSKESLASAVEAVDIDLDNMEKSADIYLAQLRP